jgi:hypothetical protein
VKQLTSTRTQKSNSSTAGASVRDQHLTLQHDFTPEIIKKEASTSQHEVSYRRTGTTTGSFQVLAQVGHSSPRPLPPALIGVSSLSPVPERFPVRALHPPLGFRRPTCLQPCPATPSLKTWRRPAAMWKRTHQSGHCVAAQPKACCLKRNGDHWRAENASVPRTTPISSILRLRTHSLLQPAGSQDHLLI